MIHNCSTAASIAILLPQKPETENMYYIEVHANQPVYADVFNHGLHPDVHLL